MPSISISYRDEGNGSGAFFDHATVRNMTGWSTQIVTSKDIDVVTFSSYINYREGYKMYGLPQNCNLPIINKSDASESAFIFIPGYTRDSDKKQTANHKKRLSFEKKLIRKAINRGQPILAVCAGSWTLWESFGGKIKAVTDHNYGGAMPRMSKSKKIKKATVCNNKMIHDVVPVAGTYIANGLLGKQKQMEPIHVNSVHWNAVDPTSITSDINLCISAHSKQNDEIAPKSRQSKKMKPENSVEAFETKRGVIMLGVQWHLEAFNLEEKNSAPHKGIFDIMKMAGKSYLNRRELNKEFIKMWKDKGDSLTSFFSQPEEVLVNNSKVDIISPSKI